MRPKRCTMCPSRARDGSFTCSDECGTARMWKQRSLNRHRDRSKVPGTFRVTVEDWMAILRAFKHRCAYCGRGGAMTIDHVLPLSRGGRHCVANLVPACRGCNHSKGALTVTEWRLFSRSKRQSKNAKMQNAKRPPWTIHEDLGIRPIRKKYSAAQNPIFNQVMQEQHDRIMIERMGITVDYFGVLV